MQREYSDEQILSGLRADDEKLNNMGLRALYKTYHPGLQYLKSKYGINQDTYDEAFQEAIVIFYYKAQNNAVDLNKGSIRSFLSKITRNRAMNIGRKGKNNISLEMLAEDKWQDDSLTVILFQEDKDELMRNFYKLGEKCKKLLTLFYFHGCSIEVIVIRMNFVSNAAARMTKSRCMKELRGYHL